MPFRALFLTALLILVGALSYSKGDEASTAKNGLAQYGSGSVALASKLKAAISESPYSSVGEGDDITITQDPIDLPQNEPSVKANPLNPLNLVTAANDYRLLFFRGAAWIGYYTSMDGGRSWTNQLLPGTSFDDRAYPLYGYDAAADPSVDFDLDGNAYIGGIVFNIVGDTATDGSVFVARSTDTGSTFPSASFVNRGVATRFFNDKPYLAVDKSPESVYKGRVYVSWTQFNPLGALILLSYSTDQGNNWSSFKILSGGETNQGSIPAVGPSGELYVTWLDYTNNTINLAKSLNGGESFSPPVIVHQITPVPPGLPNTVFRTNSFPTIAVDDVTGAVYIAWNDYGSGNSNILFTNSEDGGATWSSPVKVNDDETLNDQFFPWLTTLNGTASIVFYDRRVDPNNHDIDVFLALTDDGGLTFSQNVRVSDVSFNPDLVFQGQFIGDYIGLAASPGTLHPVWADNRNVNSTNRLNQDILTDLVTVGVHRDVGVRHVTIPRDFAFSTVEGPTIVEVEIANFGNQMENISLIILANSTIIYQTLITEMISISAQNVTIEVRASSMIVGKYDLSVNVAIQGSDSVPSNNSMSSSFQVRLAGDANADRVVEYFDLGLVGIAFLTRPADPLWNPEADFNNDGTINFLDLGILGNNFLSVA